MQLAALKEKGYDIIFQAKVSEIRKRPKLEKCLSCLRYSDTSVIYKFDRLGRSLKNLLYIFEGLRNWGIGLVSMQDGIDGSSPTGKLMMTLIATLASLSVLLLLSVILLGVERSKIEAVTVLSRQGMLNISIIQ